MGRIVSLTGKTSGYPTLADARTAKVFHGNCTHNIATAMTFEGEIAKANYVGDHEKKVQSIDVPEEVPRIISNLDSVLEKASLPEDMMLFPWRASPNLGIDARRRKVCSAR